jgi:hypothetical protein
MVIEEAKMAAQLTAMYVGKGTKSPLEESKFQTAPKSIIRATLLIRGSMHFTCYQAVGAYRRLLTCSPTVGGW